MLLLFLAPKSLRRIKLAALSIKEREGGEGERERDEKQPLDKYTFIVRSCQGIIH